MQGHGAEWQFGAKNDTGWSCPAVGPHHLVVTEAWQLQYYATKDALYMQSAINETAHVDFRLY